MMFNENSIVVQAWVRQIKQEKKINQEAVTLDDVPALFNLRDVVTNIINNTKGDE